MKSESLDISRRLPFWRLFMNESKCSDCVLEDWISDYLQGDRVCRHRRRCRCRCLFLYLYIYLFLISLIIIIITNVCRFHSAFSFVSHTENSVRDHMRTRAREKSLTMIVIATLFEILSANLAPLHFPLLFFRYECVFVSWMCQCLCRCHRIHMNENDKGTNRLINKTHDKPEI